jgi:replicative DNA helicase
MSLGNSYIHSLLRESAQTAFREIRSELLLPDESELYQFVRGHLDQHGRLPDPAVVRAQGLTLNPATEPPAYYADEVRKRFLFTGLSAIRTQLGELLRGTSPSTRNPDAALAQLKASLAGLTPMLGTTTRCVNMTEQFQAVLEDIERFRFSGGMRGVTLGFPTLNDATSGLEGGELGVVAGRPGMGKAQPLDSKVKVPGGWKLMGALNVGDRVASPDGKPSKVTGVFPQGEKQVFKIIFGDGREAEACGEHLWVVNYREWKKPRTLTTSKLREMLARKRYHQRLSVELLSGDNDKNKAFPLSPYALGALLGDGCTTRELKFTSADAFVVNELARELGPGMLIEPASKYDFALIDLFREGRGKTFIRKLYERWGLWGCKAPAKFIPEEYYNGSRAQRLALLQGLMDTDGWAEKQGSVRFASSSKELALDVQRLVWSLGGMASVKPKKGKKGFSWTVGIRLRSPETAFRMPRKKERVGVSNQYSEGLRNIIKAIEPSRVTECQCISVSHPSHCYVTDNYVVTHNTWILMEMAYQAWRAGYSVLFVSMEMGNMQIGRRWLGRHAGINPKFLRTGEISHWIEQALHNTVHSASETSDNVRIMSGAMSKNVSDIEAVMAEHLPDIIYIDAAYLLSASKEVRRAGASKWEELTEVIRELKQLALRYNRPVIVSVQFNRNVSGNSQKELDLRDIGGTDAIPQDASLVIGLRYGKPPHERLRRILQMLKNREGESRDLLVSFGFSPPLFLEIETDDDGNETDAAENPLSTEWML